MGLTLPASVLDALKAVEDADNPDDLYEAHEALYDAVSAVRDTPTPVTGWTLNDSAQDDEPEHVCGPWPYLFEGDCPGCQWRMDRA